MHRLAPSTPKNNRMEGTRELEVETHTKNAAAVGLQVREGGRQWCLLRTLLPQKICLHTQSMVQDSFKKRSCVHHLSANLASCSVIECPQQLPCQANPHQQFAAEFQCWGVLLAGIEPQPPFHHRSPSPPELLPC